MLWHVSLSDSSEHRVLDHGTPFCCKFSSKSPTHILKHHLWNLLINKPILTFISHYGWILCWSWRSKWVVSVRQNRHDWCTFRKFCKSGEIDPSLFDLINLFLALISQSFALFPFLLRSFLYLLHLFLLVWLEPWPWFCCLAWGHSRAKWLELS